MKSVTIGERRVEVHEWWGSDKSRAGFTSRVVVISEADGMDTAGGSTRGSIFFAAYFPVVECLTKRLGSDLELLCNLFGAEVGRSLLVGAFEFDQTLQLGNV
jgi:hypothetical protein